MKLAPSERDLWVEIPKDRPVSTTDREINERYARGEGRIVIESNREKLPGFVNLLNQPGYMDLRPFYQRRPRWKPDKQSLLIESFIMNIPVPPVFLYENDYNSYEVMDGQQRITALRDFYNGELRLIDLERWPEINGRDYDTLPDKIRAGLDRRSISSIVMLKESTSDEDEASILRETVFERLNTGGVRLGRQEIRNALYKGKLNSLIEELSRMPVFRTAWRIPSYTKNEIEDNPEILENPLFSKMEDVELVLRFFALRHVGNYRHGMQGFLDLYMRKSLSFTNDDLEVLADLFRTTLNLASDVYEGELFRPFNPKKMEMEPRPHKAFYDAVMVGLSDLLGRANQIRAKARNIRSATIDMFMEQEEGTFTGRGNTKEDVQTRIRLFREMIEKAIG